MKPYSSRFRRPARNLLACALLGCIAAAGMPVAFAQTTAATIRGQVTVDAVPAAAARVTATNVDTGLVRSVESSAEGRYSLAGLPPGTYRVDVTVGGQSSSRNVTVRVGQTASLDLAAGVMAETGPVGEATELDRVTVTATLLTETRTSEVAAYVSPRQIEALPQSSRNFLAFADTIPGMQFITSANGEESQLRSGAQGSSNINVFIDGVGQKNYVTPGGITGQDDSRGNPFPQSAIGEYKVITSNYKAEFDQISSAAVVAVTRSGTNEFEGSFFWDRTSDDWRAPTIFEEKRGEKAQSRTEQYGVSFGGPIVRDLLHFFISYEAKDFEVPAEVIAPSRLPPGFLPTQFEELLGNTSLPFRQDLYFGKLTYQAGDAHLFDLSVRHRDESSLSGIGGINTVSYGNDFVNDETRVDLRYQFSSANWLNEAHIGWEESSYNPRPITMGPGLNYQANFPDNSRLGVLNIGGGRNFQDKGQQGFTLQDDLTFFGWEGHTLKMGVKFKDVELSAFEQNPANPQYFFDIGESLTVPNRVEFGAAIPGVDRAVKSSNQQFGIYIQDDWHVNEKLTLNLGLRWDYEKTPGYQDFVVRPELAAALRSWPNIQNTDYDIENYISDGSNRKAFKDAWQPRLGFSYDLAGDQRHVVFGGAGRAYDRNLFDYVARERNKGSFPTYTYFFNTPAYPCTVGGNCVEWNPRFYDPATLAALVAANPFLGGEVNLINNDLKTPYADQFSLGMRNALTLLGHDWNSSVTLSHIRSHDGIVFRLGNRYPDGRFRANPNATWGGQPWGEGIPGFGTLILADNGIETRLNALLVSMDKPYTVDSRWGVTLAYTFSDAEENRSNASHGETYIFDYPSVGDTFYLSTGVPRHRFVATGILDGPMGLTVSSKLTLASHRPRDTVNCSDAPSWDDCFFDPFTPEGTIGFKQFDIALQKEWDTGSDVKLRVRADLLNAFNWRNYNDFEGWRGGPGENNPAFAQRNGDGILDPTRTFKVSLGFSW
ncbi:MAG: TonB-dependent receptor [Pseudomonadota bacterium]|nr:TonB-dependent receptor [Pseudomonadota bacterium]